MALKNIALIGKGCLGTAVLQGLVDGGFTVTVIGRTEKNPGELPAGATSAAVNYSSHESLVAAFKGKDAIVSTVGVDAIVTQKRFIDAAIDAGVTRFIPSDFGNITTDPTASHLPAIVPLVEIQNCGAFTEFTTGMFDWRQPSTMPLWGDGYHTASSTSIAGIGKAISGVFHNPESTRNRNIKIHELVFTQALILDVTKKAAPVGVEVRPARIEDTATELQRLLKKAENEPTLPNIYATVAAAVFGGQWKASYDRVDNDLVGLSLISDEEFQTKIIKTLE